MPPLDLEPIIVESKESRHKEVDRDKGDFSLYDADWPVDTQYTLLDGPSPLRVPHFPPGFVAEAIFARPPEWMKDRLKGPPHRRQLMLNRETPLEFRTVARGKLGERRFTLADIERLAWALYERGDIDGHELQCACTILLAMAEQYKKRLT